MDYSAMPRAELISELKAWENKYDSKLKDEVSELLVRLAKLIMDLQVGDGREVLARADKYLGKFWVKYGAGNSLNLFTLRFSTGQLRMELDRLKIDE